MGDLGTDPPVLAAELPIRIASHEPATAADAGTLGRQVRES